MSEALDVANTFEGRFSSEFNSFLYMICQPLCMIRFWNGKNASKHDNLSCLFKILYCKVVIVFAFARRMWFICNDAQHERYFLRL